MKIYLELVFFIFLPMIIFISWYYWNRLSTKKLLKKYQIENDKSKKGGEECKAIERTEPSSGATSESPIGLTEPEGRELLSATSSADDGKTSNSNRKNGRGIRKLLRRRK